MLVFNFEIFRYRCGHLLQLLRKGCFYQAVYAVVNVLAQFITNEVYVFIFFTAVEHIPACGSVTQLPKFVKTLSVQVVIVTVKVCRLIGVMFYSAHVCLYQLCVAFLQIHFEQDHQWNMFKYCIPSLCKCVILNTTQLQIRGIRGYPDRLLYTRTFNTSPSNNCCSSWHHKEKSVTTHTKSLQHVIWIMELDKHKYNNMGQACG